MLACLCVGFWWNGEEHGICKSLASSQASAWSHRVDGGKIREWSPLFWDSSVVVVVGAAREFSHRRGERRRKDSRMGSLMFK
jgi:hypothetical protein